MKSGLEAWGQEASFCDRNYCGKPFWLKSQKELMLSTDSNGHCPARTCFSLYNRLCLGSAAPVEIPRLLGGLAQEAAEDGAYSDLKMSPGLGGCEWKFTSSAVCQE